MPAGQAQLLSVAVSAVADGLRVWRPQLAIPRARHDMELRSPKGMGGLWLLRPHAHVHVVPRKAKDLEKNDEVPKWMSCCVAKAMFKGCVEVDCYRRSMLK